MRDKFANKMEAGMQAVSVLEQNFARQYQALQACESSFLQEVEDQFEKMFETLQASRIALLE